jgi:MFS transporter, ACS family, solute carrier family 17 (sodium-dependent inorganic phosphate cotransporter), other
MKVNALDLSPNYAGTLMGITNGIGALTGIAAVSLMVKLFESDADEVCLLF